MVTGSPSLQRPLCLACGRSSCRCGEPYPSIKCSKHGTSMKVVSIASWDKGTWIWTEAVGCTKCEFMRPLKYGQGVPRNENTKTVSRMRKKFRAESRTLVSYPTTKQKTGRLSLGSGTVHGTSNEDDKRPLQGTCPAALEKAIEDFWKTHDREKQIKEDEEIPF